MSRTRSRNTTTQLPAFVQKWYNTAGTLTSTMQIEPGEFNGQVDTITDENHPHFRSRIAKGEIIIGELSLVKTSYERAAGFFMVGPHPNWGKSSIEGDFTSYIEQTAPVGVDFGNDVSRISELALIKAYANVNPAAVLSGEIMGSLAQTVGSLRRPFKSAVELLSRMTIYRAKRLGKTANSARTATANTWLEHRYGWQPIIMDSSAIAEEARKYRAKVIGERFVARGGGSCERSNTQPIVATIPNAIARGSASCKATYRIHAGVIYSLKSVNIQDDIARIGGFRAVDAPATLWELLPWSFVADWFVKVGPWIEAIMPRPDVNILGTWRTTVFESEVHYLGGTLERTLTNPTVTYHGSYPGSVVRTTRVTRESKPVLPTTPPIAATKWQRARQVDAVALTSGLITRALSLFRH